MPELKDIGGGFKIVDGSQQSNLLETAQRQLGLVDLVQRIQVAPLEQEIKKNELLIKQEAVKNAPLEAELKQLQKNQALVDEQAKRIELGLKQVNAVAETFAYDFNTGANAVREMGGEATDLKDGTALIKFPGQAPILKKIGVITNPEKVDLMEEKNQKAWIGLMSRYGEIYTLNNTIKDQLALGTKDGDISAIYAKAKMMDEGGRVTEGDVDSVLKNPSVLPYLKNQLVAALNSDGPYFGELGSKTRRNFEESANVMWQQRRRVTEPLAKNFIEYSIIGEGLNLGKVAVPVGGDLTPENLGFALPKKGRTEETQAPSAVQNQQAPQVEQQRSPQLKAKEQPSDRVNRILRESYLRTFGNGKGK